MHGTSQPGGFSPKQANGLTTSASQLKPGSENARNSGTSFPPQTKGKKRERGDHSTDPVKWERSSKTDDSDSSGQHKTENIVKSGIAKITEKGRAVDFEGVEKHVQLMQPEGVEERMDLSCSVLAGVVAATEKVECLNRFVQLKGLSVFNECLQEIHEGKVGGGNDSKGSVNALIESCVKYSEVHSSLPPEDDVGMNLLANVETGEMSRSELISPTDSTERSTPATGEVCFSDDAKSKSSPEDQIRGTETQRLCNDREDMPAGERNKTCDSASADSRSTADPKWKVSKNLIRKTDANEEIGDDLCFQDSIDRLPDELLISIVSRLPVIEAGRTSILARRWRYLWMFNLVLIFDGSQVLRALEKSGKPLKTKRIKFMKGVNKVLKLLSSTTVEEFRIVFDLDERYSRVLKQWLKFAFARRVRRLELDLAISSTGVLHNQRFIFPNVCQPLERLQIFPLGLSSCEYLVTLNLREVDVTGEVLEFFLSNCPFLEELCVRDSSHLKNLRTCYPSIRLRHLEIVSCMAFRSLDICTPNLCSFTFYGLRITMALKNVSSLSSLSLGAELSSILTLNLIEISRCLSRLETLRLHTPAVLEYEKLPEYLYLPRLKNLILDVCAYGFESLLCYTPLINGAPLLREIVLKMTLCAPSNERRTIYPAAKGRRHQCLEVLRIEGFSGTRTDVELAQYVVDISVSLKKIVIGLHPPLVSRHAGSVGLRQRERAAVEQADVLRTAQMTMAREGISLVKARLPVGVQLIIL